MFKLTPVGRATCATAVLTLASLGSALAFVQNPEIKAGQYAGPTGLDVFSANWTRHKIRVDSQYGGWPDLYLLKTFGGPTMVQPMNWWGFVLTGCGANEFQVEGPQGWVPPPPMPYWSLPDSIFRTATPDGKGGLIYTERPTRPGVCADAATSVPGWTTGSAPLGRVWWDSVNEAFSYRIGRPVRAFRAGNTHVIHGGPLQAQAHVCAAQHNGVTFVGSFVSPICAVQVREPNGDMSQRNFGDRAMTGAPGAYDSVKILMDTQLTGTQWSSDPELQDKLAVTLEPLPGQRLPRKLCQATLPVLYKDKNPMAVGWTDDSGRCHVPQSVSPAQYNDPTRAVVLNPGSYRVLITFKYTLAGVGDARTANPELFNLWQKVRAERQY